VKAYSARTAIRRLAIADAAFRLGHRLAFWAAAALLVWSADILVATMTAMPETVFHTIVMTVLGTLPAFLLAPCHASLGLKAVRRIDRDTAIESWLAYRGGPAGRMLESRAAEALSIADIAGFGRPRMTRAARVALLSVASTGLCVFALTQIISIRAGYGLSLLYPDKSVDAMVARRSLAEGQPMPPYLMPDSIGLQPQGRDSPGARRSGIPEDQLDQQGSRPTFGRPDTRDAMDDAALPGDGDSRDGTEPGDTQSNQSATSGQPSSTGSRRPAEDQNGDRAGSEARAPGYTGTGKAMSGSPLVDYRARLERLFAESTGTETALGSEPSSATVAAAIRQVFSSFETRVVVGQADDPVTARVLETWRAAFSAGGLR
jgi:hypothetical protein